MKLADFMAYAETAWEEERQLLEAKGREYTMSSPDKHENFKQIAAMLGITPEQACAAYLLKHIFSIVNYVKIGKTCSNEPIQGRIHDARNYLLLLGSLLIDEDNY